jgi:hypothetical protein
MDVARYFVVLLAVAVILFASSLVFKILAAVEGNLANAAAQAASALASQAGPVQISATPDNATGMSASAYASGMSAAMPVLQYIPYIVAAAAAAVLIWTRRR